MATAAISGLPVGMVFDPTDHELIEDYLLPKVKGCYADYGVVTEADVFEGDPRLLRPLARYDPGDGSLYFFASRTRSTPNGTRAKRTRDKRGWVFTDRPRAIKNRYDQVIGQRRLFVYKIGGKSTPYRLHEYKLHGAYESPSSSSSSGGKGKAAASLYLDLVLCRVWFKPGHTNERQPSTPLAAAQLTQDTHYNGFQQQQQQYHHFEDQQLPSCSSEEGKHQSGVPTSSVPTTQNDYYTSMLQAEASDDEEIDKELAQAFEWEEV